MRLTPYHVHASLFIHFYFTHLNSILGVTLTQNTCSTAYHSLAKALSTGTNRMCKRTHNVMQTWPECCVWTSESRPTSVHSLQTQSCWFFHKHSVFATTSGLQFLLFVSVDGWNFWPTITEITITDRHQSNNHQSLLKQRLLITAEITIATETRIADHRPK